MARRMAINLGQRVPRMGGARKEEGRARTLSEKKNVVASKAAHVLPDNDSVIKEAPRGRKRTRSHTESTAQADTETDLSHVGLNDMRAVMGFEDFTSTKNKHVVGTDCYGINLAQKLEYRQYMNRQGGFNRPLSPGRESRRKAGKIKLKLKKESKIENTNLNGSLAAVVES